MTSMNSMSGWVVRIPASSANLGAGFDVLGMALGLHAEAGIGDPPGGALAVDDRHPAGVAFRRAGGTGSLWMRSPIPIGRGLGFSGAARVGGAAAAAVQQSGPAALDDPARRAEILTLTSELERHADNVAASIYGGVVVATERGVVQVPLAFNPMVVVWVPNSTTTSTEHSRGRLPDTVSRADAVFNVGRAAMFVAACANGEVAALRAATEDRLHQQLRLEQVPESAAALDAALAAGAWAAWLSGSGPTIAALCDPGRAEEIAAVLPASGHVKLLRIDHEGVVALGATGVDDDIDSVD
jgi:homoserine kinase